jgi:hypothetical protein
MDDLKVIMQLMEELQDKMSYGEDDFAERLGKKKPGLEVLKIEGEMKDPEELQKAEEMLGMDLEGDKEEGEDPEHVAKVLGKGFEDEDEHGMEIEMEVSPEDKLKKRIMKMRG